MGFSAKPGASGAVSGSVAAEAGMASWFALGRTKWAAKQRPWDNMSADSTQAAQLKKKVLGALQTMQGSDDENCNKDEDVLLSLLDMIDTQKELDEFEVALGDEKLFLQMKAYLSASRAELLDFAPLALIAGCFAVYMFSVFNKFAATTAEEIAAQQKED